MLRIGPYRIRYYPVYHRINVDGRWVGKVLRIDKLWRWSKVIFLKKTRVKR
jgi:hypothetical protein